jgi:hypothetical protein
MIYNQATTVLVRCFLLGDVANGDVVFLVLSWWCFVLLLQGIYHCSGTLFSVILLFFGCVLRKWH